MRLIPGLTVLVTAAVAFMITENVKYLRQFHQPRFEFAFWVTFLFILFSFILLAEDTPIKVNFNSQLPALSVFGLAIPLMSAAIVEAYFAAGLKQFRGFDKDKNEVEIQMDPHDPNGLARAQSKLRRLNNLLDNVMYSSQVRMFTAWLRGVLNERRKMIQDVLVDTTPEELNHILSSVNIPQLFTYGNYYSKQNSDTLEYIITERGRDLTIIARASLLHGLMRMHTLVFHEQQLEWAISTLLGAKGSDLTLLKNLLDSSGDYNNLFKLVFVDINDNEKREKVLDHINIQAKETIRLNKMAEKRSVKILSDIDDTLFSSGGVFPAGADTRFPRHEVYPGVLALFEEIDVYARTSGHVLTKRMRKSIKRLSRKRRSKGLETANLKDNDEDFEGELKQMVNDTAHEFVVDTGRKVLVSIELPWSQGGGVAQLSFDPNVPVSKIQSDIEARFHLPPWKQNLIVTSDRPLYDDTDVHKWKHGNVVFISARPHAYKDITENGSYRKFHKLIGAGRMHATPTLLAGDMSTGLLAVVIRTFDEFGVFLLNLAEASWEVIKLGLSFGSRRKRRKMAREEVEDGDGQLTVGRILTRMGTRETTNRNWYGTGLSKAEKFEKYASLYPEYSFVFFGDNGQGDLLAAEHMAHSSAGSALVMSFIHDILPEAKLKRVLTSIGKKGAHEEKSVWAERNIIFFRTYVGAAIEALEAGLIPVRGLYRVTRIAQAEMVHAIADSKNRDFDFSQAIEEINEDIDKANAILAKRMEDDFEPVSSVPV